MSRKKKNIVWEEGFVCRGDRERKNGHRGVIVWLTGLPASGKTTIAVHLEKLLHEEGRQCYRLDGDNIRHGLNSNLGFSQEDRDENIRRIGEVAKLYVDSGFIVITSFISPYRKVRDRVRASIKREKDFIEVYLDCSLQECERRDPKGMYAEARAGRIREFTGISAPYEKPDNHEIILNTMDDKVEECVELIYHYLKREGYLSIA